jgi:hypothetical protein
MKQTVVEWIEETIGKDNMGNFLKGVIEKAKVLEFEQRKEDFRAGWHSNKHKDWNCEFYLEKYINNDFKAR